jgi:hypothetical protein
LLNIKFTKKAIVQRSNLKNENAGAVWQVGITDGKMANSGMMFVPS